MTRWSFPSSRVISPVIAVICSACAKDGSVDSSEAVQAGGAILTASAPACVPGMEVAPLCVADGTVITTTGTGMTIKGPKGRYSLIINSGEVSIRPAGPTPASARALTIDARGATFSISRFSSTGNGKAPRVEFTYTGSVRRDFLIDVNSDSTEDLAIRPVGHSWLFTLGPSGARFGGGEWDFGGDEWDVARKPWGIIVGAGKMLVVETQWDSCLAGRCSNGAPEVQFDLDRGIVSGSAGSITVASRSPFGGSLSVGGTMIGVTQNACRAPCDQSARRDLNVSLGTGAATLTVPSAAIKGVRVR